MLDIQKFLNASLQARESIIDVPELATWFAKADKPTWTVRGLTAAEMSRARDAGDSGLDNIRAMVSALAG